MSKTYNKVNSLIQKIPSVWFMCLTILIAYVPFLNLRMLRMAGDEKVYISQSIEMARSGSWFVQTLANEPNYFKGPLHYILTRIGMMVFGNQLIAGTWFNAFFAVLAALAMYTLAKRYWSEKSGILLGVATALNVGVYSHGITSQMEVTVCAFWAIATAFLGLAPQLETKTKKTKKRISSFWSNTAFYVDLPFWLTTGIVGWVKSPAHSVLIGMSGIFYWALTSQLKIRMCSIGSYLAAICGIAICLLGYMPALLLDTNNFIDAFVLRENLNKANNNRAWHYTVLPLLHFIIPWTFVLLWAMKDTTLKALKKNKLALLGLAMAVPTIFFWAVWTYKGQNYSMPTTCALLLFAWATYQGSLTNAWCFKLISILGLLSIFASIALVSHFWPLPLWWNPIWLFVAFLAMSGFVVIFYKTLNERWLSIGATLFFIAFGAAITPLGTRELEDVRPIIKANSNAKFYYYNLEQSIWSEWGIMQLALHQEIFGLHNETDLRLSVVPNTVYLINSGEGLNRLDAQWRLKSAAWKNQHPFVITPWTRWLTKGRGPDGNPRWKTAWKNRDLSELEKTFYIVKIK